jgi:Holliday junction DNA helicase RuvA
MMLRGGAEPGEVHAVTAPPRGAEADAVAALVKLGYGQGHAAEMVARAARDLGEVAPVDAIIREALKAAGR